MKRMENIACAPNPTHSQITSVVDMFAHQVAKFDIVIKALARSSG
jgi:hypothetical protein